MDKLGRLTRWDEWVLGELYAMMKGGERDDPRECIEINQPEGYVRFKSNSGSSGAMSFNWRNRYVHVPKAAAEGGAPSDSFGFVYDKTGRPIFPGDTLKVYHFRDARRREHRYMYKYVTGSSQSGNTLVVSHLNVAGDSYLLAKDGKRHMDIEIVQGFAGVPSGCDFRARKPNPKATAEGGVS